MIPATIIIIIIIISFYFYFNRYYQYYNIFKNKNKIKIKIKNTIKNELKMTNHMSILHNLFVRSGNNNVFVKYNGVTAIINGSNGFNIVIVDKLTKQIKHSINIDTGIDFLKGDMLIDLIQNHIKLTDIIIVAIKKDATRLLSTEAKFELKKLGMKEELTKANSSYILIGSLDKSIHYEKVSWEDNVFFPHIILSNIGKWDSIDYDKKIPLTTSNGNKNVVGNTNSQNIVHTCAILAKSFNYNLFTTDNKYCYLLSNHIFNKHKVGSKYKLFTIHDTIHHSKNINNGIKTYTDSNFIGNEKVFYDGVHDSNYLGGIEYNGGLVKDSIKSLIIPEDYLVILTDKLNISKQIVGPKLVKNVKEYGFASTIKQIVVQHSKNKIIFWSNGDFTGFGFALSYGKHIVPDIYFTKINSININLNNIKIKLFTDNNFNDLYAEYNNNKHTNIYTMDNVILIKSIIIEPNNY
jgi:hypothetical protein